MQNRGKMKIEPVCEVCGNTAAWHREKTPAHAFSLDGQLNRAKPSQVNNPSSEGTPGIKQGGDPVLRMALIRKGLLTVEDLDQVEAEIRATGISHT